MGEVGRVRPSGIRSTNRMAASASIHKQFIAGLFARCRSQVKQAGAAPRAISQNLQRLCAMTSNPIWAWAAPQYWVHCPVYLPGESAWIHCWFTSPGIACVFPASIGTQKPWITSALFNLIRTGWPTGIRISLAVTKRCAGSGCSYSTFHHQLYPVTVTVTSGASGGLNSVQSI